MNRDGLGCFIGLYALIAGGVILCEVGFVLLVRMDLFYTQDWFGELHQQSRNDAMDCIDNILALAVWPLVALNIAGLVLMWVVTRGRRKEEAT